MCCDVPEAELVPPAVAEMLAEYRRLQAGTDWDWGDEYGGAPFFAYGRFFLTQRLIPAVFEAGGDWDEAVRVCLRKEVSPATVFVTPGANGVGLHVGPRPYVMPGHEHKVAIVIDTPGVKFSVATASHAHPDVAVQWEDWSSDVAAVEPVPASARLRVRADAVSRWSVVDDRGGGWWPDGLLRKHDFHGRPFFHGDDVVLDVPPVPLTVSVTRCLEFGNAQTTVTPAAGEETIVELEPERVHDPAAEGWYGGDLHVHMNYSGDLVCAPHDAARMQMGEGLHLMNLVAANAVTSRIYEKEALEHFAGRDLPWTADDRVARWGVEYRNDLLGHFHALSPSRPPSQYQSGHERSDHADDWPPNSVACEEFRGLGATIGYTHPVFSDLSDDSPAGAFRQPRSVEARELVADVALGLVDSMDLLGPNNVDGTVKLYHHLLNCGFRLAATVGTDVFLSFSNSGNFSNPPGWARVYANLNGSPLSVSAFQDAVRAGRTVATNGPWLTLEVEGLGPGGVIDVADGQRVAAWARCVGPGVESLEIVGPDGAVASASVSGKEGVVEAKVPVRRPIWLAAVARGPGHPDVLGPVVFAHTSPVYIDVDGRRIARTDDARWCLEWLDLFEKLLHEHGRFTSDQQRDDVLDVVEKARAVYRAIT